MNDQERLAELVSEFVDGFHERIEYTRLDDDWGTPR